MASCPERSPRTGDLSLVDFCNGSDTRTKTYIAPLDTTSIWAMEPLGSYVSMSGRELSVPVSLRWAPQGLQFLAPEFVLKWDSTCARLTGIRIPPASPFHGKTITQEFTSEGLKMSIPDTVAVANSGELFSMIFQMPDSPPDTVETELKLSCRLNANSCKLTDNLTGHIRVLPVSPWLASIAQDAIILRWNRDSAAYDPQPFPVIMRITNSGELPAEPLSQRIEYDARVFSLHPASQDSVLHMIKPLAPSDTMIASWTLLARHAPGILSSSIATVAEFSNHGVIRSSVKAQLPIPGARAEILRVAEAGERTQRAEFRVHCDGDRVSAFQDGSISAAVEGRPVKVLSVRRLSHGL